MQFRNVVLKNSNLYSNENGSYQNDEQWMCVLKACWEAPL